VQLRVIKQISVDAINRFFASETVLVFPEKPSMFFKSNVFCQNLNQLIPLLKTKDNQVHLDDSSETDEEERTSNYLRLSWL
jgi:hypothetical protein